jgi:hypothetical protein
MRWKIKLKFTCRMLGSQSLSCLPDILGGVCGEQRESQRAAPVFRDLARADLLGYYLHLALLAG